MKFLKHWATTALGALAVCSNAYAVPPGTGPLMVQQSQVGVPGGVAALGSNGQVPIAQLPVGTGPSNVAAGTIAGTATTALTTASAAVPKTRLSAPTATWSIDQQQNQQWRNIVVIADSFGGHWAEWPGGLPGATNLSFVRYTQDWFQQGFHATGSGYIPFSNLYGLPGDPSWANGSYPGIIPRLFSYLADQNHPIHNADAVLLVGFDNDLIPCVVQGVTALCPLGSGSGTDGTIYNVESGGAAVLAQTHAVLLLQTEPGRGAWGSGSTQATASQIRTIEQYRLLTNNSLRSWCHAQAPRCQWIDTESVWTKQNVVNISITSSPSAGIYQYTPTSPTTIPSLANSYAGWTVYPLLGTGLSSNTGIIASSGAVNATTGAITLVTGSATLGTTFPFSAVMVQNGTPTFSLFEKDGPVHPHTGAAQALGMYDYSLFGERLVHSPFPCESMDDTYAPGTNTSGIISFNCLMVGNNGSLQTEAGLTGTVPSYWRLNAGHTSTGTFTGSTGIISGVTGPFSWLNGDAEAILTASRNANSGGSNEVYALYQSINYSQGVWKGGDIVHSECMMKMDAGYSNLLAMYVQMYYPKNAAGAGNTSVDGGDASAGVYPYYNSTWDGQWQRFRSPSVIVGGEGAGTGSAAGTTLTINAMSGTYLSAQQGGVFQTGAELYVGTPNGSLTDTGVALAPTNTGTGTGGTGTYTLASALTYPAGTQFVAIGLPTAGSIQLTPSFTLQTAPDIIGTGSISTSGVLTMTAISGGQAPNVVPGMQVTWAGMTGGPYVVQGYGTNGGTGTGTTGSYQLSANPGSAIASTTINIGNAASATMEIGPCVVVKDPPGTLTMRWGDMLPHIAANDSRPHKKAA